MGIHQGEKKKAWIPTERHGKASNNPKPTKMWNIIYMILIKYLCYFQTKYWLSYLISSKTRKHSLSNYIRLKADI